MGTMPYLERVRKRLSSFIVSAASILVIFSVIYLLCISQFTYEELLSKLRFLPSVHFMGMKSFDRLNGKQQRCGLDGR
jgi:hypothetical protein